MDRLRASVEWPQLIWPFDSLLFCVHFVVPVIAVTPWDFVWKRFVTTPGERWTRTR